MWSNNVEGLCGNFDGNTENEFEDYENPTAFGNSLKYSSCPDVVAPPPMQEPCMVRII